MGDPEQARAALVAMRDEVRTLLAASCGSVTVGDMAADAIDYHADCDPWGWDGRAVVCRVCDDIILPTPEDVLDQGALAWSR